MKTSFAFKIILSLFILYTNIFLKAEEKPKLGLVLSGGGAKGIAHIGVLKVLESRGIRPDFVVGTSMGGLVGGLYSIGYSPKQLEELVLSLNWDDLLSDYLPREYTFMFDKEERDRYLLSFLVEKGKGVKLPEGFIQGQNVLNLLCKLTAKYHYETDFSKFPIPFACVAGNIASGKEVVINSGYLPEALFSSMALPTVFAPIELNDQILVDGGIMNNFPVDVIKKMGAELVIGVDIQTKLLDKNQIKDVTDVAGQLATLLGNDKYLENKKNCDIIIEPDITGYSTASFSREAAIELIAKGEKAAIHILDSLENKTNKLKGNTKIVNEGYSFNDNLMINNISVEGIKETGLNYIIEKSKFKFPGRYNFDIINEGIKKLYGTDSYKTIYYKFLDGEHKVLQLLLEEKPTDYLNAGFNYNSIDKASILLNLTLRNKMFNGARFTIDLIFSKYTSVKSTFQFIKSNLPEINIEAEYKQFDFDVYDKSNKIGTMDIKYSKGSVSMLGITGNNYFMGVGGKAESYYYVPFIATNYFNSEIDKTTKNFFSFYAKIKYDDLDNKYLPSSGNFVFLEFDYFANKLSNLFNSTKTAVFAYNIISTIRLGSDFYIIPKIYGRLILDENQETLKSNFIGGEQSVQHLDYNLPFTGIYRGTLVKDKVVLSEINLRLRINDEQYLSGIFSIGTDFRYFTDWQSKEVFYGWGAKYTYLSIIGPIEASIVSSDYTKKVDYFISIGKWFNSL